MSNLYPIEIPNPSAPPRIKDFNVVLECGCKVLNSKRGEPCLKHNNKQSIKEKCMEEPGVEPIETAIFTKFKELTEKWLDHRYRFINDKHILEIRQKNKTLKREKNWIAVDTSKLNIYCNYVESDLGQRQIEQAYKYHGKVVKLIINEHYRGNLQKTDGSLKLSSRKKKYGIAAAVTVGGALTGFFLNAILITLGAAVGISRSEIVNKINNN